MTTIVADFRLRRMGCDSKYDWGGTCWYDTKLFRVGDAVVGLSGNVPDTKKLLGFIQAPKPKPLKDLEAYALVLRPTGLFAVESTGEESLIGQQFFAIGSGGNAALGVLMHGGTLEEALEIASRVDSYTAGPFHFMELPDADPPA